LLSSFTYNFPDDWNITQGANHWSNENNMIEYIQEVTVPYVEFVHQELQAPQQAAMAIFDNLKTTSLRTGVDLEIFEGGFHWF